MRWCAKRPRLSARCWRAEPWPASNACASPIRPSPAFGRASASTRSGTPVLPVSGSGFAPPAAQASFSCARSRAARGAFRSDRSPRTESKTFAADAIRSWRARISSRWTRRRTGRRCSATSSWGRGRTLTSPATNRPHERVSTTRSSANSCPPSVQLRSVTSTAIRCCAGSTPTVSPPRAGPISRSVSFARS